MRGEVKKLSAAAKAKKLRVGNRIAGITGTIGRRFADVMRITDPIFRTRLRIGTGLVLFAYVLAHFLNHALGLWSWEVMERAGGAFRAFWQFTPISIVLYGSLAVHMILALVHIFTLRSWRMAPGALARTILGLSIPFFMALHLLSTRMIHEFYDFYDSYDYILVVTFVQSPREGLINSAGLIVVWLHACLGLYNWLKVKRWFGRRVQSTALFFATLVPVLALTGFLSAGREIAPFTLDEEWLAGFYESLNQTVEDLPEIVSAQSIAFKIVFGVLLALLILTRVYLNVRASQGDNTEIRYLDGPVVRHPVGASLLEISRFHSVPHASVCGGLGRCSTCRIKILNADYDVGEPDKGESRVLKRVGAPPDVRLACQFVPRGNMEVARLLPFDATVQDVSRINNQATGVEQTVAVMFADIRGFTQESESKLPFDVVYLINQFSRAMGEAIEQADGTVDKFLGDGLMALFGVHAGPEQGSRDALRAASLMQTSLDELNKYLKHNLDEPLRMGIGIHSGPVVLGEMGYGRSRGLTAIGDTVNTASRLEASTKEFGVSLCISAEVANFAGVELPSETARRISIRGKKEKILIHTLDSQLQAAQL